MIFDLITRDKRFKGLFWTQFFGAWTDNYFKNALVLLVTYRNISLGGMNSQMLVAFAAGIFILPFFLFSAVAGQIADRYEKSFLVRVTKYFEIGIMTLGAISFYFQFYGILFVLLFLMGTQSSFFGPLKLSLIPEKLNNDELVKGNAYISSGTFVGILLGTLLGGALVGPQDSLVFLSIGLLLFSGLGLYFSFKISPGRLGQDDVKIDFTLFRPSFKILREAYKNRKIFMALIGSSWFWFVGAGILLLLPTYTKNVLGGDQNVANFFLAIFTIGMGIGALFFERMSRNVIEIGIVPIACLAMGIFFCDLFWIGHHWVHVGNDLLALSILIKKKYFIRIIFDLLFVSFFGGIFAIPQITFVQTYSSEKELSRMIAANNILNAFFMVMVSVSVMFLYSLGIKVEQVFLFLAVMNTIVSFALYMYYSEETVRLWGQILSHLIYNVEVIGLENMPKKGPFLIAANHVSFIDWILLMAVSSRPVRFVIDFNYYYFPMGPFWFKQAALVPIATQKENPEVLREAYEIISDGLSEGHVYGIFPEGFLTKDGAMRELRPGILKILKRDDVEVIPVTIDGLWGSVLSKEGKGVFKKWPKPFFRRKVRLYIGRPLKRSEFTLEELKKILDGHRELDRQKYFYK